MVFRKMVLVCICYEVSGGGTNGWSVWKKLVLHNYMVEESMKQFVLVHVSFWSQGHPTYG